MKDITSYIAMLPAMAIAISVFNYAQALMAIRLGDTTPQQWRRDTMNPFAHLDILGLLMMLIANVGWSKPMPFNPQAFPNPRWGMVKVALAGIGANLGVAFVVYALLAIGTVMTNLSHGLEMVGYYTVMICIGFSVFNILPIPGLLGFSLLLQWLSPEWQMRVMSYQLWFFIGLIILAQFGLIGSILRPIYTVIIGFFDMIVRLFLVAG